MNKANITVAFISIILTLMIVDPSLSQVTQEWVARYNSPGNFEDLASSIATDGSGNAYVTGCSSTESSGYDITTIKYNSSGIQQWISNYNGPGNSSDYSTDIVTDIFGNVYITGYGYGSDSDFDFITIKYNSAGIQQWVKRYNGTGDSTDYSYNIEIDISGNLYVTGASIGTGTNFDFVTIKYNSDGNIQWIARYNGLENNIDFPKSTAVSNQGNVYVTGYSKNNNSGNDYTTVKYNSAGIQQWVSNYNGTGNSSDQAVSIALDNSENVYVTGSSIGNINDYATIKYNSDGVQKWVTRYDDPGNGDDVAVSVAADLAGNVYVTGNQGGFFSDIATIKYDSLGIQQWVAIYNDPANYKDAPVSMIADKRGYVYVAGQINGNGLASDYGQIKYDSSGIQQWIAIYNSPGYSYDSPTSMMLDSTGNIYLTGISSGAGYYDFITIKYSQTIGINQISSIVPEKFSLSQNYPNPFNPTTKIKFEIAKNSHTKLYVCNVLGKVVSNLVDEQLQPGSYETEFDGSNLTSGVYFYRIETESFTDTKKLMILK